MSTRYIALALKVQYPRRELISTLYTIHGV